MKEYGPLKIYPEGGYKGEGILRYVKPIITQGTHKANFAKNLMMKYYMDRLLQNILEMDVDDNQECQDEKDLNLVRYTKFQTYGNLSEVKEILTLGDCISVVIDYQKRIWVS